MALTVSYHLQYKLPNSLQWENMIYARVNDRDISDPYYSMEEALEAKVHAHTYFKKEVNEGWSRFKGVNADAIAIRVLERRTLTLKRYL